MPSHISFQRQDVQPGMTFLSSHGYKVLVTEVQDTAEYRGPERMVGLHGYMHGIEEQGYKVSERYRADSYVEVEMPS